MEENKSGNGYELILLSYNKTYINVFKYKIKLENNNNLTKAINHMIDYSIKDFPDCKIKIVPSHGNHFILYGWRMRDYDTVKEIFNDQMTKVLNNKINIEDIIFRVDIIPNEIASIINNCCYLCKKENKIILQYKNGCCKECFDNLPNIIYPTGFKTCYICKISKPINDYYFDKRDNLPRYICKICNKAESKKYHLSSK